MGRSYSTLFLAGAAIFLTAIAVLVITTMVMSDDEENSTAGTAGATETAETGEQHVYLLNLGMT